MHNSETKKTSPNLLTRNESCIFKPKTSKKNSRSVAYKPLQKTVSLPKFAQTPVTSRKEMIMSFLKEMLCEVIAHREYASSKDLTDSGGTTISFDHFFGTTSNLKEFEEESKKSIISSQKESRTSELEPERSFYKGISCERELAEEVGGYGEKRSSSSSLLNDRNDDNTEEEDTWSKCMRIYYINGNVYEGEMDNCLIHGHGTFAWSDGTIYEGEFRNGYPTGKGKMILSDLSTYTGEFCMGYFHGHGVFNISETSIIYKGQWKNGKRNGKGWISYGPDNWYDGEWFEDQKHGSGYRHYTRGLKYRGQWAYNKKNGLGSMLWSNNDFYHGQWKNNKQHGYGEYTWNVAFNKFFTFLIYNWYKGTWMRGKRTGLGLMHFGLENGSKLAGTWQDNLKNGPGVLSSGNGELVACVPLFENDKPVHKSSLNQVFSDSITIEKAISSENTVLMKNLFRTIVNLINKKEPLYIFDENILKQIVDYSANTMKNFVKIAGSLKKYQMWHPLKISVHVVAEAVNLKYYINEILVYYKKFHEFAAKTPTPQKSRQIAYASEYLSFRCREELQDKQVNEEEAFTKLQQKEEQLLKNFIIINLPKLREIYTLYTKFTHPETTTRPILTRLFLWQLLRDVQLFHRVSLVEADLYFSSNPWSCSESDHNPFEEIYFWQFLQYLVGCSWLFQKKNENLEDFLEPGIVVQIFKRFLEKEVFPNFGKFEGTALRENRDLLPIKGVYELYRSLGEPHSVRTFLNNTYTRNKKDPPCYFGRYTDTGDTQIYFGYNSVSVGDNISFIKTKPTKIVNHSILDSSADRDIFRRTLFTFRTLGKRKIIKCITTVFPNFRDAGQNIDLNYKINFLEFYEIILMCALEKAEGTRRIEDLKRLEEKKSLATSETQASIFYSKSLRKESSKRKKARSFVT